MGCRYYYIKKIKFFLKKISISMETHLNIHKAYYHTNKKILKKLPKYYILSLSQFVISISIDEKIF